MKVEMDDVKSNIDHMSRSKQQADQLAKALEGHLAEANGKLDESSRTINDLNANKSKLNNDVNDLQQQLEDF